MTISTLSDIMRNVDEVCKRKERLAMKNADKMAELNQHIDETAARAAGGGWINETVELSYTCDGEFDFRFKPDVRINYAEYYSRFGTPKPTFIASKLVIKDVIFNPPATIVFWNDGTKTVVKAKDEVFDWEKGLAMAISKKYLASNEGRYYNVFRKYEKAGIDAEYKEAVKNLMSGEDITI